MTEIARKNGACRVTKTAPEIGTLSGALPELLSGAFPIAAAGTVAKGACLRFSPGKFTIRRWGFRNILKTVIFCLAKAESWFSGAHPHHERSTLSPVNGKPILPGFDGSDMSSNAGLVLLREIERRDRLAAHGNGGRFMRELIDEVFTRHLPNDTLDTSADSVALSFPGERIMFTTDGFTFKPLEISGGPIGSIAVHGTINDLAVAGAYPLYLSLNAVAADLLAVFSCTERKVARSSRGRAPRPRRTGGVLRQTACAAEIAGASWVPAWMAVRAMV
nr:AIR synthase related protein [Aliiruegeria sabulilitoris]